MTQPNPKDPQAELYLKQEIGKILGDRVTFGHHHYFRARNVRKKLLKLFQAHQQELLSELLGEAVKYRLADGSLEPAVPVSVIEKYREGL